MEQVSTMQMTAIVASNYKQPAIRMEIHTSGSRRLVSKPQCS
jgi:hypothetical protein